jgi:hypothetical protein
MTKLETKLAELKKLDAEATQEEWVDWYGALCIYVTPERYRELVGLNMEQGPPFRLPKKKENMDLIVKYRNETPKLIKVIEKTNNSFSHSIWHLKIGIQEQDWGHVEWAQKSLLATLKEIESTLEGE